MTFKHTLRRLAGLLLCAAVFASTALAGDNGSPGNSGNAPGQEKKAEQPSAPAEPQQGNSASAPGQEKKAEEASASVSVSASVSASASTAAKAAPGQVKQEAKQEAKAETQAAKAVTKSASKAQKFEAKAQTAVKIAKPEHAATPQQAVKLTGSQGQSALAHHHVVICHRTGSDSNPYVVINIPMTAWNHAHSDTTGAHPDRGSPLRHDLMLKDPASHPGSKDGFSKSACGAPAAVPTIGPTGGTTTNAVSCPGTTQTVTEQVAGSVTHKTGSATNPNVVIHPSEKSAHMNGKHSDDTVVAGQTITKTIAVAGECGVTTTSTAGATTVSPAAQPIALGGSLPVAGVASPAASGVAGAVSPAQAAQGEQPAGGVLGATARAAKSLGKTAASGTLPFTGMPLWIAALIGAALLAAGLTLRRSS
jgi:hypothetical protein